MNRQPQNKNGDGAKPFHSDLGKKLHARLRAVAARNDRSMAAELRVAVRHHVELEEARQQPEALA